MKTPIPPSFRALHTLLLIFTVICVATLLTMGLIGCSNTRFYSEADPTINFRIYHSFALIEERHRVPAQSRNNADIMEATIEQALENEMLSRGNVVDETAPDLLIQYAVETSTESKLVSQPVYRSQPTVVASGVWRPRYYVTRTPVVVGNRTRAETQREGVLVIDVINRVTGKVIWHGWSEEPIQGKADEFAKALADNVHDIMKAYPVRVQ